MDGLAGLIPGHGRPPVVLLPLGSLDLATILQQAAEVLVARDPLPAAPHVAHAVVSFNFAVIIFLSLSGYIYIYIYLVNKISLKCNMLS